MAAVINEIRDPNDYPIIYYWRNDDYKDPIVIYDRPKKGVMYNIYNREKGCFEMRINSYTFNGFTENSNDDVTIRIEYSVINEYGYSSNV